MSVKDDLQAAFAGESQANRSYLAFAQQADKDGYPQVAKLFRAVADAETIHALAHLRAMDGVKSTAENLQKAIEGEHYEYTQMYPEFLQDAQAEGDKPAEFSFKNALAVEEIHHGLYQKALEAVGGDQDLAAQGIHVCPVCGNTVVGDVPDRCEVCGVPGDKFFEVS